jgi:hypothetical protein
VGDPEMTSRSAKAAVFGNRYSVAEILQLQRRHRADKSQIALEL